MTGRIQPLTSAIATGEAGQIAAALGELARKRGGIQKLAERTGLDRSALHRALAADGNPQLATLMKVLGGLELRLRIEWADPAERRRG